MEPMYDLWWAKYNSIPSIFFEGEKNPKIETDNPFDAIQIQMPGNNWFVMLLWQVVVRRNKNRIIDIMGWQF